MDGDDPAQLQPSDRLYPELGDITLAEVCGTTRFKHMDRMEAYFRCLQYEDRPYEWDGLFRHGGNFRIYAQHYVPHRERRPSTRYELARLIVRRFTAMVFGSERFPQIVVDGDEDAQDYVRELAKAARIRTHMHTLRNKGGAQGTACASFAFVNGRPRVRVHNAKHITILGWEDRDEFRPSAVLESYAYPRTVWENRKTKQVTLYFARYWDQEQETIWDPIPEEAGRKPGWMSAAPSRTVRHGYGFCPVYWTQNLPDPDDWDGDSDFEGMCDNFDGLNQLLSATGKGTVANVDPTLVIHMNPQMGNTGAIKKGSENAIYSEKGAAYLELSGTALEAALKLATERKQEILDTVGVVLGDPDKMAAKALSAQAMRILYLPMITQADILREQYGEFLVQLLTGMLRAARMIIGTTAEGVVAPNVDGIVIQDSPTVRLPPRAVPPEEEDGETTFEERVPGDSENITLNWPPYFPNTWEDNSKAVAATQAARGGQGPLISRKTAVENLAPIFGVDDVVQELADMEDERAEDLAFQQEAMKGEAEIMAANEPPGANKGGNEDA